MTEPKEMLAVVYLDDGPGGPCGQECVTTSAHTRVYLFHTESEMNRWLETDVDRLPRRKRSRLIVCYPKGHSCHTYANSVEVIE